MTMAVDFIPTNNFLYVSITGTFSLPEANDCVLKIFKAIADHNLGKVLVDCRNLTGEPTTFERFEHAAFSAKELNHILTRVGTYTAKFAYLGESPLFDPGKFGETVAVNRGINVMTTNRMEKAVSWLDIDPAKATECLNN